MHHNLTLEVIRALLEDEVDIAHPRRLLYHALHLAHVIKSQQVLFLIGTSFKFVTFHLTILRAELIEAHLGVDTAPMGRFHQSIDVCAQVGDKALQLRHLSVSRHASLHLAFLEEVAVVRQDVVVTTRHRDAFIELDVSSFISRPLKLRFARLLHTLFPLRHGRAFLLAQV